MILGVLLAALTVGAVMAFASSSTVVTTNIALHNNTAPTTTDCPDSTNSYWHFVLIPNNGTSAFVTFHLALQNPTETFTTSTFTLNGGQHDNVFVAVPAGHTLTDLITAGSSADITGPATQFNLSHVCAAAKSKPTIETNPGEGGKVGVKLNDTATLADGSTSPAIGGTITFKLYPPSQGDCSGSPVYTDVVTVNGNDTYDTATQGNNSGGYVSIVHGTYQWTADYSGDDNNEAASSGCGQEAFVTETAASTVLTDIKLGKDTVTEVPLGSVVHDHATVTATGAPNTPQGTVDFTFYNGTAASPCSGTVVSTENGVALDANGEANSSNTAALAPGTYGYLVHYNSSDTEQWTDGDGTCEPLTVDQGQLKADTILHNAAHATVANDSHVGLGSVMHDTAQITGNVSGFLPTGAVTFTYYSNYTECNTGGAPIANLGADEVTSDPRSAATSALAPGTYAFQASVAGDTNYKGDTSGCEPFIVDQGQLTADTILHNAAHDEIANNSHVGLGSVMHDTAQISGAVGGFTPTGAVTFTFYKTIDCTDTGTDAGNNGGVLDPSGDRRSDASAALAPGSYGFTATVAGDTNYKGDTSGCEPFIVDQGQLTADTILHKAPHVVVADNGHVALGTVMHDTAQITGQVPGFDPTGAVTFTFYKTIDCTDVSGPTASTGADEVSGDPRSAATSALGAGSYGFTATVAGDDNYLGDTSGCEPFIVDQAQLRIVTQIHNASHGNVGGTHMCRSVGRA